MTTALKSKEQPDIFMQNCVSVLFFSLGKVFTYFIKFPKEFINPIRLQTLPGLPEFLTTFLQGVAIMYLDVYLKATLRQLSS